MILPSRHRIQNSSAGGLRPSTLPLGHGDSPQYWIFTSERRRYIWFLWNLEARVGDEPAISDYPNRQLQPLHQLQGPIWNVVHAQTRGSTEIRSKLPVEPLHWIPMYGSTAIINIFICQVRGPSLYVKIWRIKTVPVLKGLKCKFDPTCR